MCPVLTVSLDCPFFIAPSGFSDIYFQILTNSRKGILKFFVLLVSLSDDYISSFLCIYRVYSMSKRNREEYDRLWSMQSNKVCIVVSITISEKNRA
jgi:hypothetical protein